MRLIAKLQLNRNLIVLSLDQYNGSEIPRWGRAQDDWATTLPNLVHIDFSNCERLKGIPLLSKLKHLKSLYLEKLNNLEYMEMGAISQGSTGSKDVPFFPSLESLTLYVLKRLKRWWGRIGEGDSSSGMPHWQPPLPRLKKLDIYYCHELTSLPPCPMLESLQVTHSNKSLRILPGEEPSNTDLALRVEGIDSLGYLTTKPARRLTHISINQFKELETNSEIDKVLKSSSSLRSLQLCWCVINRPISVSGVLKHLTALESLPLKNLPSLEDDLDDDMPWRSLCHNLRVLTLWDLKSLQVLPKGMRHLTALQELCIISCYSLEGLPEWICCLQSLHYLKVEYCPRLGSLGTIQNITSLQKLVIIGCPELEEACKEPSGKEWPNIRHIPHFSIYDWHVKELH